MREILDQQVLIQLQKKKEEERINPEELSYGLLGKMLDNRKPVNRQQQYYLELQKQIEEKQRIKEAEKYMNEEEYKLNLNQLNVNIRPCREQSKESSQIKPISIDPYTHSLNHTQLTLISLKPKSTDPMQKPSNPLSKPSKTEKIKEISNLFAIIICDYFRLFLSIIQRSN